MSQSSVDARLSFLERLKLNGRDTAADKKAKQEAKGKPQYRQDAGDTGEAAKARYLARIKANARGANND